MGPCKVAITKHMVNAALAVLSGSWNPDWEPLPPEEERFYVTAGTDERTRARVTLVVEATGPGPARMTNDLRHEATRWPGRNQPACQPAVCQSLCREGRGLHATHRRRRTAGSAR